MRVEQNIEERDGRYILYVFGCYQGSFDTIEEARKSRDSLKSTHKGGKRKANVEGFTDRLNKAIWDSDKDVSVICRQSNVSRSALWSYRNGIMPKCDNLARLAVALNVSSDWLLGIRP